MDSVADIAFTDSVIKMQALHGSREWHARTHQNAETTGLSALERDFIAQRDSFYQATVSETGWPYVQHRGGPKGFLRVLDLHTLGYADFRGNLQYLSAGNLTANNRVALILMDYPNRLRLKIWGYASMVSAEEQPALMAQLVQPDSRARVERGVIIKVAAFDWNCPQHITPRYTLAEIEAMMVALNPA